MSLKFLWIVHGWLRDPALSVCGTENVSTRAAPVSEVQRLGHELAALDERIAALRSTERREAFAQVQGRIDQFVLTRHEVFGLAAETGLP
ncbi:hypothetical protein [Burkholderia anthina]|uniref:hypothetical protein n=1 Tax=Burkholderia anthina TaxID=179879 RepID=UPI00158DFA0D|nr:hypothetical protein [Burkholderia anthina]